MKSPSPPHSSSQDAAERRAERHRWIIQIVMLIGAVLPLVFYWLFK